MKTSNKMNRRRFLHTSSALGVGLTFGLQNIHGSITQSNKKAAILGGPKAFNGTWPGWPIVGRVEEDELLKVLKSAQWCRLGSKTVPRYEKEFEKMTGAKYALATSSGSTALTSMLGALDIGPGDEVIMPPYTFIATYNVITQNYALPVFVDVDIESFQIDASKIENAITSSTKVLMPVHIGGSPFDVDAVLKIAKKHNIPMIEDACQAHLAEWKGKCVGNFGLGGAFSMQASKNLNSGEGGTIITNDEDFYNKCYGFHHQGQNTDSASLEPGSGIRGSNLRLTEFQGAILLAQMSRLEEQVKRRSENADYLTQLFNEIDGITPAKLYDGTTRSAYHLYMFRYDGKMFSDMSRAKFIKALNAEGIPCYGGYTSLSKNPYVRNLAKNKHYLSVYGEKTMNDWLERNECPQNDKLTEEAIWFGQSMLLGTKRNMEQIAEAVKKISKDSKAISMI